MSRGRPRKVRLDKVSTSDSAESVKSSSVEESSADKQSSAEPDNPSPAKDGTCLVLFKAMWCGYAPGDRARFDEHRAELVVRQGYAVRV